MKTTFTSEEIKLLYKQAYKTNKGNPPMILKVLNETLQSLPYHDNRYKVIYLASTTRGNSAIVQYNKIKILISI